MITLYNYREKFEDKEEGEWLQSMLRMLKDLSGTMMDRKTLDKVKEVLEGIEEKLHLPFCLTEIKIVEYGEEKGGCKEGYLVIRDAHCPKHIINDWIAMINWTEVKNIAWERKDGMVMVKRIPSYKRIFVK